MGDDRVCANCQRGKHSACQGEPIFSMADRLTAIDAAVEAAGGADAVLTAFSDPASHLPDSYFTTDGRWWRQRKTLAVLRVAVGDAPTTACPDCGEDLRAVRCCSQCDRKPDCETPAPDYSRSGPHSISARHDDIDPGPFAEVEE